MLSYKDTFFLHCTYCMLHMLFKNSRLNAVHTMQHASIHILCCVFRPVWSLRLCSLSSKTSQHLICGNCAICFFISTDLERYSITSFTQQWMLCSEWVPSEWESDKNITIIHTTPVHQLSSGEAKSCVFVRNNMFLTSNHCFRLKIQVHNP